MVQVTPMRFSRLCPRHAAWLVLSMALGSCTQPTEGLCSNIHDRVDDCCCFVYTDDGSPLCTTETLICSVTVECLEHEWVEGEGCPLTANGTTTIINGESVDCAMQVLRDGTPGQVSWHHSGKMDGLVTTRYRHVGLHVQQSIREAYVEIFSSSDDQHIPPVSPARHAIRDREYFEMCGLLTDLSAKAGCVFQAIDGDALEICSGS